MRILLLTLLLIAGLGSCTNIVVENYPGKQENAFPEFMHGKYTLVYPESLSAMMEGSEEPMEEQRVAFSSSEMVFALGDSVVRQLINDSVAVCKVKNDYYLCIGEEPELTVMLIKQKERDLELYPMFCLGEVEANDLKKYFKTVNKQADGVSINVTVNPKKLKAYFDSEYPSKDPFVLKRMN